MGYLYRNRAVTGLVLKSEEAARQEAWESVSGTCFGALGANAFRPLGRDLGMPKGSRGGIWAIRPSAGTAQAARPPLLGLLWSGSSWETIYRRRQRNEDLLEPIPERGFLIQHAVNADQGAAQRYRTTFNITGNGPTANFLHPLPLKPSPR